MTQEQKQPSSETVSKPETASQPVQEVKPPEPAKQPLTPEMEARIQQLIAEATQGAMEKGREFGKREMQAIKDREVAQEKRKAEFAERRVKSYETGVNELDEDTRARIEAQRLRGENEYFKSREQDEETRRQQEYYFERLNESLKSEVTLLGIDPSDKRIDYAQDAKDYFDGRKRFSESLAVIIKANRENLEKTALTKAEERFKQLEAEFRKAHGLDSQDTTASAGAVEQSDADFMAAFGAGDLPITQVNSKRYEEIQKKYYK